MHNKIIILLFCTFSFSNGMDQSNGNRFYYPIGKDPDCSHMSDLQLKKHNQAMRRHSQEVMMRISTFLQNNNGQYQICSNELGQCLDIFCLHAGEGGELLNFLAESPCLPDSISLRNNVIMVRYYYAFCKTLRETVYKSPASAS